MIEVVNLVASVMPLVSLSQIVDGNSVITGGILTARGQQASDRIRLIAWQNLTSM